MTLSSSANISDMRINLLLFISIWLFHSTYALADIAIDSTTISFYKESDQSLSLATARALLTSGDFTKRAENTLTFGILSPPVWLHFNIQNTGIQTQRYRLTGGVSWIDNIDLYLINSRGEIQRFQGGDRIAGNNNIVPGAGVVFELDFTQGTNQVFIRAQTSDPMVLPIKLSTLSEAATNDSNASMLYGLLYGFLIALIAYNLMFYHVLKRQPYLYYGLVIICFIIVNIGYTGLSISWLLPDYPVIQNYMVISMMVIYSLFALSFASKFLLLKNNSPLSYKIVRGYQLSGLTGISLSLLFQSQAAGVLTAFIFTNGMAAILLALGIVNINRISEGRYFFSAATFGMLGVLSTGLSVMGVIPYSQLSFHGAEIGVSIEASIFAFALVKQIKIRELSRVRSEQLANFDPLTELHNRRSFYELAKPIMDNDSFINQPLSIIMIDIDKFKSINDDFGHSVGDQALKLIAQRIMTQLRSIDIAVRWGGDELLIFLPEIDNNNALHLAQRIRSVIAEDPLHIGNTQLKVTISLGLAFRHKQQELEAIINSADLALLKAKQTGRNKVVSEQLPA
ncbi:MAG: sensor domain-containing diguanylate cyclase [Gammaproteobacteria bacterium]|nr:sensor domain-containing diguanylate cyclase [Gammaproteobacteria bacterium]